MRWWSIAGPLPPDPLMEETSTLLWTAPYVDVGSLVELGFRFVGPMQAYELTVLGLTATPGAPIASRRQYPPVVPIAGGAVSFRSTASELRRSNNSILSSRKGQGFPVFARARSFNPANVSGPTLHVCVTGRRALGLAASPDRAHQISLANCRCHRTNNERTNS